MKYCLCCGEDVPFNRIVREGNQELTCIHCGFVLDVKMEEEISAVECIITSDDAPLIRELLKGMLVKKGFARTVIATENGQECMMAFNKRLAEDLPVEMVILDLEMPVMDGITAARIMRSIEQKYQASPTPILFFSARKCDDQLKRQIGMFLPASYVNKGSSDDPDQLLERIDRLATYLLKKKNPAAA